MEREIFNVNTEMQYPVLFMPKKNTTLATTYEVTDDLFIDLSIKTATTDGIEMSLYSGLCNIKFIDSYDVNIKQTQSTCAPRTAHIDQIQMVEGKEQSLYPPYSQSQVWIDPERSPFVYNSYSASEPQARCSVYRQVHRSYITVEQRYSPAEDLDHKKFRKIQAGDINPQNISGDPNNPYEDEYECGEFFSQLSEEIINEKEARAREEIQLQSENDALKPLMSSDTQLTEKQQKTILSLGQDPHFGQTTHKIPVNDPSAEYAATLKVDQEVAVDDEIQRADSVIAKVMSNNVFLKDAKTARARYRKACNICSKFFDRIGDLKRHLIEHIIRSTLAKNPVNKNGILNIQCEVCQTESFSKIDKYKAHLREHAKLTLYQCTFCKKSFSDSSNFSKHKKFHGATCFQCDICQRKFNSKKRIILHMEYHNNNSPISCSYCKRTFHFESTLNKHIKSAHTKEMSTRFRCRFCHQYFKTLKEKWDHEWTIHNARKNIIDCLICDSKFRKYSELKRHYNDTHDLVIPHIQKFLNNHNAE